MRLLCISDIHGHAPALAHVLAVGRIRQCSRILVAGDICFPGPEPVRCWSLLARDRAQCVQGLSDKALATVDPDRLIARTPGEKARLERLRACREELGELIVRRLEGLPRSFRMALEDGGELLMVHGSPADPTTCISHDMSDSEIQELLGEDPPSLVVCGGTHVPFDRVCGTTRIINVGSVGEAPGGQVAHATIVVTSPVGVQAESLAIPLAAEVSD